MKRKAWCFAYFRRPFMIVDVVEENVEDPVKISHQQASATRVAEAVEPAQLLHAIFGFSVVMGMEGEEQRGSADRFLNFFIEADVAGQLFAPDL